MSNGQKDDEAAIRVVLDRLFKSYQAKDVDTMLSCYTDDIVVLMPPRDSVYGMDEWRRSMAQTFQRIDIVELDIDFEEIIVMGDWAWEWHNEWSTIYRRKSEETVTGYIRGAHLLRRDYDGRWKVARFIANLEQVESDLQGHKGRIRSRSRAT